MKDITYIRLDDDGVTETSSCHEFCHGSTEILYEMDVGSRITINSFYNLKTVVFLILLGCAPLLVFLNMTPNAEAASAKRYSDAQAKCVQGVAKVHMTSFVGTKTINCGE